MPPAQYSLSSRPVINSNSIVCIAKIQFIRRKILFVIKASQVVKKQRICDEIKNLAITSNAIIMKIENKTLAKYVNNKIMKIIVISVAAINQINRNKFISYQLLFRK